MDGIRAAMGDKKLNYFGFSYGTFLGATYASLFPDNYRAMVLDGPVDANSYINTPSADLREQIGGLRARARPLLPGLRGLPGVLPVRRHRSVGGLRRARRPGQHAADPGAGFTADPRPVNGDDILDAPRSGAVHQAATGRCSRRRSPRPRPATARGIRDLADAFWGNNVDGTFDPGADRYFTIGAIEQKYSHDVQTFLDAGDNAWGDVQPLLFWNTGYVEINYALWPIHAKDAFYGPFTASEVGADGARGRDDV